MENVENQKECCVCHKAFGSRDKRRQCQVCRRSICSEHSIREREKVYVCVYCEIEAIKNAKKNEVRKEISRIVDQNKQFESELEKLTAEKQVTLDLVRRAEEEILSDDKQASEKEEEVQKILDVKLQASDNTRRKVAELNEKHNQLYEKEIEYRNQARELEVLIESLNQDLINEKLVKHGLGLEMEHLNQKIISGLPIDHLNKILCFKCKNTISSEVNFKEASENDKEINQR